MLRIYGIERDKVRLLSELITIKCESPYCEDPHFVMGVFMNTTSAEASVVNLLLGDEPIEIADRIEELVTILYDWSFMQELRKQQGCLIHDFGFTSNTVVTIQLSWE